MDFIGPGITAFALLIGALSLGLQRRAEASQAHEKLRLADMEFVVEQLKETDRQVREDATEARRLFDELTAAKAADEARYRAEIAKRDRLIRVHMQWDHMMVMATQRYPAILRNAGEPPPLIDDPECPRSTDSGVNNHA